MLCRRSASFTTTTRTSWTIASSILRTFFRLSRLRSHHVQAADFGDAFDEQRYFLSKSFLQAREGTRYLQ